MVLFEWKSGFKSDFWHRAREPIQKITFSKWSINIDIKSHLKFKLHQFLWANPSLPYHNNEKVVEYKLAWKQHIIPVAEVLETTIRKKNEYLQ